MAEDLARDRLAGVALAKLVEARGHARLGRAALDERREEARAREPVEIIRPARLAHATPPAVRVEVRACSIRREGTAQRVS